MIRTFLREAWRVYRAERKAGARIRTAFFWALVFAPMAAKAEKDARLNLNPDGKERK